MLAALHTHTAALATLCQRHHVRTVAIFGSAVRDDLDANRSDLDFLVEFQPLAPVAQSRAYFGLLEDLEQLFGRTVDLLDRSALRNPYIRTSIEQTRETLYVAA